MTVEVGMDERQRRSVTSTAPNCGEVKVLSRPCGFDHLAALMEFGDLVNRPGLPTAAPSSTTGADGGAE